MVEKEYPELYSGWKTVRKLGTGSFGAVYEIQRDLFGTLEEAALKVITIPQNEGDVEELRLSGYDDASITEHFKGCLADIVREYSLMAQMKGHTNIVYCDDIRFIQHDSGLGWDIYIKMELLIPLLQALNHKFGEEQVIRLGKDLCAALILCKENNIVHRDIKPQNIFVSRTGDYKLGDFGIAKTMEHTTGGTKIGTYNYMAPEVYNNQPYGSSADIYSLGLVMYWLLNERRMPFLPQPPKTSTTGDFEKARLRRFSGETIPAPAHGSEELKQIVLKACAYDPEDRYQSAEDMLSELDKLCSSSHVATSVSPNQSAEIISLEKDNEDDATVSAHNQFQEIDEDETVSALPIDGQQKNNAVTATETNRQIAEEGAMVSAYNTVPHEENESEDKTVGAFSTRPRVKSDTVTKKHKKPTGVIIGVIAAVALCVLIIVLFQGISKSSGTDITQEDSGKWVIVKSSDFCSGELVNQVEYKYGEYGRSELYSVY